MFRSKKMYLQSQATYERLLTQANECLLTGDSLLNFYNEDDSFDIKFVILQLAANKYNESLVVQSKDIQRSARMGLLAVYRNMLALLMNEQKDNVANGIPESYFIIETMAYYSDMLKSILDRLPPVDASVEEGLQHANNAVELRDLSEIYQSHAIYQCAMGSLHVINKKLSLALVSFNKAIEFFEQETTLQPRSAEEIEDKKANTNLLSSCKKNILLAKGEIVAIQQLINEIEKQRLQDSVQPEEIYSSEAGEDVTARNADNLANNAELVKSAPQPEVSEAKSSPVDLQLNESDDDEFVMVAKSPVSPSSTRFGVFSGALNLSTQAISSAVVNPVSSVSPRPRN
jgi:hypothetical protein